MIFTFTKHPIVYLLEHHYRMFSGIQKLVAIYANSDESQLKSIVKNSEKSEALDISNFSDELNNFRLNSSTYSWYEESSLPFRIRQTGIFQKELFDEIEKTVLLLRIPSELDNKNDLLFIYFDKTLSNLTLGANKKNKLMGDTKPLIANLLYKSVISVISDAQANQNILKHNFNPGTQSIIQSYKTLKSDYTILQSQFNNTFQKLSISLFYKYLDSDKYSIALTKEAIEKLIIFNGNYEELEAVIKNTVAYITTLYLGDLPKIIEIEGFFINTDISKQYEDKKVQNNRYTKTIILLDNLNEAVKNVISQKQSPTGSIVGQSLNKPISAPAISDALKNHKSKILTLLDEYPNRWVELKQYFKPIQNIRINSSSERTSL